MTDSHFAWHWRCVYSIKKLSDEAKLVAALSDITKRVLEGPHPALAVNLSNQQGSDRERSLQSEQASSASPMVSSKIDLKAEGLEKLKMISSVLRDDYETRRELMLECYNIMIGSFEWSKKSPDDQSVR